MNSLNNHHSDNHCDLAIIGAGASGMAAAWHAHAYCNERHLPPISITLFERNERPGKKLLATGNGRCNLTNLDSSIERFHGTDRDFAAAALEKFTPRGVVALFESIGVPCVVEDDSKVFPASLHATSVLDALRLHLEECGVKLAARTKVAAFKAHNNQFRLIVNESEPPWTASAVIVATGGMCAPATGSDGNGYRLLKKFSHELVDPLPSIVQLTTDTRFVKPLSGNKVRGTATLLIDDSIVRSEAGEILFTDFGLSGPPILQLSGYVSRALHGAHPRVVIRIDFLPDAVLSSVHEQLLLRRQRFSNRTLEEFLTGFFHRRLAYGLLKHAVQKPLSSAVGELSDDEIERLSRACKELPISVTGTMSFAHAQTTVGGIATAEFDPGTMASKKCRGLFACGEVLDIDGDCGGFNLQWAWASGFLAGRSAATLLRGGSE